MKYKLLLVILSIFVWFGNAHAQNGQGFGNAKQSIDSQEEYTYDTRVRYRKSVHDTDPYIWAYSAEFAARFRMPQEWVANDLQGAEAVAFRLEPRYKTCGWGGNPAACREGEQTCVLEMYFDNNKHKLPWDETVRKTDFDLKQSSANFLSYVTPIKREVTAKYEYMTPFKLNRHGRRMVWESSYQQKTGRRMSMQLVRFYDRELYEGIAVIKTSFNCEDTEEIYLRDDDGPVYKVIFPVQWRKKFVEAADEVKRKNAEYFQKVFKEMQSNGVGN